MAHTIKEDQNTPVTDINTITNPNTKTLIDRYVFASNFCKDKTVLDCACGWGYGSIILGALGAKTIQGLDIDADAVEFAAKTYRTDKAIFATEDVTKKWDNWSTDLYDTVVSIETFEHVPRETVPQMLQNFKQVCKPDGTIVITTPRRYAPTFTYQGGTHLYEYSVQEFVQEITKVFTSFDLYYAVEFRHPASAELNTVFTKDPRWADQCAVMVAVIKNE